MITLLSRLVGGLRALFTRRRSGEELEEELRSFLHAATERHLAAGAAPGDALRAAGAEIGSLAAVRDHTRDAGWESAVEDLWRDVRLAARALRRAPGFALVATATLAVGIGANTAIFSMVNAIMLRELPVARPHELMSLAIVNGSNVDSLFSYAAYRQFAEEAAHAIEPVAASNTNRTAVSIDDGLPEAVLHKRVSGNYFTTLGVSAAAGRTLLPDDDRLPVGELVAVLSDRFWERRFARDRGVIGRTFRLNAAVFTIVGVAPPSFSGEAAGEAPDMWVPLTANPGAPAFLWNGHSTTWLRILARRHEGVTLTAAHAALEPVYARIRADTAATTRPEFRASILQSRLGTWDASGGSRRLRDNFARPLQVLAVVVGLLLVIVCANVASLTLARGLARRREAAVCLALGAGRWRLMRQRFAEALVLAALAGAAALLLATWGTSALAALAARTALAISIDLGPDLRVLAFTTALSGLAAMVFGLLPALRAAAIDPLPALKAGGTSTNAIPRLAWGRALVVVQIAVSLVLLVTAGLFVRTLMNLRSIDVGFDADGVLILQMTPPAGEQPIGDEARRNIYRALIERAETLPGVSAASASATGLFTDGTWGNAITVEGVQPRGPAPLRTFANAVSDRYFEVTGMAIARGRPFTRNDREGSPAVAVVNAAFARQFFGDGDPIGKHVGLGAPAKVMMEIVGVAADAKYSTLREQDRPMLYVPFTQNAQVLRQLEVRADGDPAALAAPLMRELNRVDTRIAVVASAALRDQVDASLAAERLVAQLSAAVGLLALALAAVGLYGVVAYLTTQRSAEIGIRIALGSGRQQVRWLVARDTLKVVLPGVVIGLPIALAGARLLEGQLYDVAPADPASLIGAVATLAVAALLAGAVPARRAARVDPLTALRAD